MGQLIKTLYVDDDPTLLDLAKEFLEGENDDLSVTTCTSGKDVLSMLRKSSYDVIISDYQMPIMSGIDLLKELRAHGEDIPFILFTGRGREEIAVDALNNGADFYLNKGGNPRVQFTELMNLVRHMVMKRQAIEALKHNAERFRAMIENSMDIIIILNTEMFVRYASPSVKKVLGIGPENFIGQPMDTLVHPDDQARYKAMLGNNLVPMQDLVELRFKRGDSNYSFFEGSFSKSKDGEGRTSIIFNGREISKRHHAEEMMRESEERYRTLFESSPAGMMLLAEGVVDCNDQALELLGRDRPSLLGKTVAELSAEEDAGMAERRLVQSISENTTGASTFLWMARGKENKPTLLQAVLKKVSVHGQPRMLLSFTEQVTAPSMAPALSISEETCRAILTTTTDAVMLLDHEGIVTFHSPRAAKMFGHGPELMGIRMLDLVDLKDQDSLVKDISALRQGLPVTFRRYRFIARDGSPVYAELSARCVPESGHLVCVFRDVTGNVLAEEQVLSANKHLAEAGELLRQDVGKHVTALMAQLQLLQIHFRDPAAREEVDRSIQQADKVMKALDNARSYSLMAGHAHEWTMLPDMLEAVRDHVKRTETALKEDIGAYEVLADPLLGNAFERLLRHMVDRGATVQNVWVRTQEDAGSLNVIIEDDGAGYSQADLDKLMRGDRPEHPLTFINEVAKDSSSQLLGRSGPDGLHFRWTFRSGHWRRLV